MIIRTVLVPLPDSIIAYIIAALSVHRFHTVIIFMRISFLITKFEDSQDNKMLYYKSGIRRIYIHYIMSMYLTNRGFIKNAIVIVTVVILYIVGALLMIDYFPP